ncbi:class I SAM-dependent methyltransferase [Clostridium sp.]|uniref:class I SAM-dependent methyltransferase n=1 Tax=Clostridium sp. TaxID=1506 RepID=UPI0034640511
MNFYDKLSLVYDKVFPENPQIIKFLEETMNKVKGENFLDVACGTGTYGIALCEKGYRGFSMDLEETMINIGKEKSKNINSLTLKSMDMRDIKNEFKKHSFSMVYCIGNSLVHLNSLEEIEKTIGDFYKIMNHKGALVIQIINYDRILSKNIKSLPTIENEEITFVRNYNFNKEDNKIYFDTELRVSSETSVYTGLTPLLPLTYDNLISILEKYNFSKIESFGDFKGSKYDKDSYSLIIRAYN